MFGRRKKSDDRVAAIVEFWVWWDRARARVATAIADGTVGQLAEEISTRVSAIHEDLQWELSPGKATEHSLVVAPGGDARLRATVARWLASAPAGDTLFEYYGARQADDDVLSSKIQIGGEELDLKELRFGFTVEDDPHDIDVAVFHPGFATLPEQARGQLTFLALDWALGEEQVETWIGAVETAVTRPPNPRTGRELQTAVADLAARHAEPVFAVLGAETRRGPLVATVQLPLRSARWPRFDTHVAVTTSFVKRDNGLPTDDALTQLRDLEGRVEAVLKGDGVLVAHETCAGSRTIHVYVDGATQASEAVTGAARSGPLSVKTDVSYDPALERVRHLRP
jgi:hypothetical protein